MSWWGKVIGGAIGAVGGPVGLLVGAFLGHQFDRFKDGEFAALGFQPGDQERVQAAFFTASFSVMGYIAKADGRVSEQEIANAENVMTRMGLNPQMRKVAIGLFQQGKTSDFNLEATMKQFRQECGRRRSLLQMFIEIQIGAAMADGTIGNHEKAALERIGLLLGFPPAALHRLISMVNAQSHFYGRTGGRASAGVPRRDQLASAYQVLGVDSNASEAEVKRAYRRLMAQHHPDKLVAKGLPEDMIKIANEKTQEIKSAYELIRDNLKN